MKTHSRIFVVFLLYVLAILPAASAQKADEVLVIKSEKRLFLLNKGEPIASYRATFGANPEGHKQQQGDERTPEGRYVLDYKNPYSRFYKSIHVSYPNERDRKRARRMGVDPGGDIMIHGQRNGWGWASPLMQFVPWTDGCVGLSDSDMDEVWDAVDPGTPIEIRP